MTGEIHCGQYMPVIMILKLQKRNKICNKDRCPGTKIPGAEIISTLAERSIN